MGYKTYTCQIARDCGGCEWLAVPYPIQLRRKQEQVAELLGGMAHEDDATVDPIRGMKEPVRYRHKAATPFAHARGGRVRCGFYAAGTHRIVPCDECLVEDPRARRILNAVARTAERLHIPPYDEDRGVGVLRHAVVRCGWKTDEVMLVLVTRVDELRSVDRLVNELRAACPEVTTIVQNVNDRKTNAILGRRSRTLFGTGVMHDELLGCTFLRACPRGRWPRLASTGRILRHGHDWHLRRRQTQDAAGHRRGAGEERRGVRTTQRRGKQRRRPLPLCGRRRNVLDGARGPQPAL